MRKFNHNSLLNLVCNAPINMDKMESLLNVLNQRSDRARKDALNHNCVIIGNPFAWFYYDYEDNSTSVISFPMEKISTGWRFFLDIEESGALYISEGKDTNRTQLPTKAISWLSKSTQIAIIRVLQYLFESKEHYCYEFATAIKDPDYLYSYIPLSTTPNHQIDLYYSEYYNCYKSLGWQNHQYGGESTKLIADSKRYDCQYVKFIDGKWRIYHLHDGNVLIVNHKTNQFTTYFEDVFDTVDPDSDHWINRIDFSKFGQLEGKSFFVSHNEVYERWSQIPEELRPRIFVEDSAYTLVRNLNQKATRFFCFDDIEDIVLNTNLGIQISFKHSHNLPEGWAYDWEAFNKKYPINNVPHKSDEDENEDLNELERTLNMTDESEEDED